MTKIKKLIKNNWIISLYYLLGLAAAIITGWLLGRPSMLHAGTLPNSTITYNENEMLCNSNETSCITVHESSTVYAVVRNYTAGAQTQIYHTCLISNNRLQCAGLKTVDEYGGVTTGSLTFYFDIGSNYLDWYNEYNPNTKTRFTPLSSGGGGYTQDDLDNAYDDGYSAGNTAGISAGVQMVLDNPSSYGLYTYSQYTLYGQNQYQAGYQAGLAQSDYQAGYNAGYDYGYTVGRMEGYSAGEQWVLNHLSDYDLYTEQDYLAYGNSKYQEGYQAGITQGETNVTSSPNDYGLYSEQQYLNNSQFSDYILQNIDSVWIDQPVYNSQAGYWEVNWIKISNNNLTIQDGTIRLDNIYTNYNNVSSIRVFFKSYFTNDIPLTFKNILDTTVYENTEVQLICFNELPNNTMPVGSGANCQAIPGLTSNVNRTGLEYGYLINNMNYFDALYGSTEEMAYLTNIYYNCIEIQKWYTGGNIVYLNSEINEINFDISGINFTSYNLGYDRGYKTGQNANQQSVYNEGFNDGYVKAADLYEDTSGNGNTLVGLAGTILFSPVNMMKDIFNFEILGVNLAGFILSIITLFVVIWLIKRLI